MKLPSNNRQVCILTTVHPPFDTRIFHKQAKLVAALERAKRYLHKNVGRKLK